MGRVWDALLGTFASALALGNSERDGRESAPLIVSPLQDRLVIGPGTQARVVVGPSPHTVVERVRRPIWDEREWVRSSHNGRTVYTGHFQLLERGQPRRFAGRIMEAPHRLEAYIADPPPEIKGHPKGPCFLLVHDNWFKLHWTRPPVDPDSAILYVETILSEALNR